jgi:hypothetical protein
VAEERVEFVDMTRAWLDYVEACGRGVDWLHRDIVHSSERGRQVLGRTLVLYLSPDPAAKRKAPTP